jgi:hypothetical protein
MFLLFVLVVIVAALFALPQVRGWIGEKTTAVGMRLRLDAETYRQIDNVIVPSRNGTTQIDHILVSVYGIFVIETKNMKGWIYGSAENDTWTQVLGGRKYQFQNPLKQNYRHTRCLAEYLHLDHRVFHSVVWFIGDCTFKTPMPENVLASGLSGYRELQCAVCDGRPGGRERENAPSPKRTPRRHAERARAVPAGSPPVGDGVPPVRRTAEATNREKGSTGRESLPRLLALSGLQVHQKHRLTVLWCGVHRGARMHRAPGLTLSPRRLAERLGGTRGDHEGRGAGGDHAAQSEVGDAPLETPRAPR